MLAKLYGTLLGDPTGDWLGIALVLNVQRVGYLLAALLGLTLLPPALAARAAQANDGRSTLSPA